MPLVDFCIKRTIASIHTGGKRFGIAIPVAFNNVTLWPLKRPSLRSFFRQISFSLGCPMGTDRAPASQRTSD